MRSPALLSLDVLLAAVAVVLATSSSNATTCCGWATVLGQVPTCSGECSKESFCAPGTSWQFAGQEYRACQCAQNIPEREGEYCCEAGRTGLQCDHCTSDAGCPDGQTCLHGLGFSSDNKGFHCEMADQQPILLAVQSQYPQSRAVVDIKCSGEFLRQAAQKSSRRPANTAAIECQKTTCSPRSDLDPGIKALLSQIESRTTLQCNNDRCTLIQSELLKGHEVQLRCRASECASNARGLHEKISEPVHNTSACTVAFILEHPNMVDRPVPADVYFTCVTEECDAKNEHWQVEEVVRAAAGPPTQFPWFVIPLAAAPVALTCAALIAFCQHGVRKRRWRDAYQTWSSFKDIELRCCDVTYYVGSRQERAVLREFNGCFRSGDMLAVMGSSGAGKTTLIDILAGRTKSGKLSGSILLNGEKLAGKNQEIYRQNLCGYVMQEDTLPPDLTVKECITYSAQLRLPLGMPAAAKQRRVQRVIRELGLDHVQDTRVGNSERRGVSGGEMKRTSIAMEMVAEPKVLLLDEPTTGLDSYNAFSVMKHLLDPHRDEDDPSDEVHRPIVIFSIHQPSTEIFRLFHQLLLLNQGHAVYYGLAHHAVAHFESLGYGPAQGNPAEFLLSLAIRMQSSTFSMKPELLRAPLNHPGVLETLPVEENVVEVVNDQEPLLAPRRLLLKAVAEDATYYPNWLEQLPILWRRAWLVFWRRHELFTMHFVISLVVGIFLGTLYSDIDECQKRHVSPCVPELNGVWNRAGGTLFIMAFLGLGSLSAIDTFFSERVLSCRERASGYYSTVSYLVPKLVLDFVVLRILPTLLMGAVAYFHWRLGGLEFGMGLRAGWDHFWYFEAFLCLFNLCAAGMCILVAMLCPSFGVSALVSVLVLLFFMAFGGTLAQNSTVPEGLAWCRYISYFSFASELILVNEISGRDVLFNPVTLDGHTIVSEPLAGDVFLANMGLDFSSWRWHFDIGMLFAWVGIYIVLIFLAVRFIVKETR